LRFNLYEPKDNGMQERATKTKKYEKKVLLFLLFEPISAVRDNKEHCEREKLVFLSSL
jgi:hypothetical protein